MQNRLLGARPRLLAQPQDVYRDLTRRLCSACDNGALETPLHRVRSLLRLDGSARDRFVIAAGVKVWDCAPGTEALRRTDGTWFTFRIEINGGSAELSLETYQFQVCFPAGATPASIRFELDPPHSRHAREGLRSHVTPGHPELRIPAPVLSPAEWLDFILYSLPIPR